VRNFGARAAQKETDDLFQAGMFAARESLARHAHEFLALHIE
jgi:DNA-directed RNA polymerase specialized sigma subunit